MIFRHSTALLLMLPKVRDSARISKNIPAPRNLTGVCVHTLSETSLLTSASDISPLKAGLISLNEIEVEVEDTETGEHTTVKEFDTLPGVELANFAVNSSYISAYPYLKGVGHVIFTEFIIPTIEQAAQYVGVKMFYIYALPYDKLISRYQRYGFSRLPETEENDLHRRLKPRYDESCKFMYLLLN